MTSRAAPRYGVPLSVAVRAQVEDATLRRARSQRDRIAADGARVTAGLCSSPMAAGIGQILDLQDRNTQLETHNTQLETHNTQLKTDNSQLKSDNARLGSAHFPAGDARADRQPRRRNPDDQR